MTDTTPIKELLAEVQAGTNPGRLAEVAVLLSSYYATLSQEIEDVLVFKADYWQELRKGLTSDKSTDRAWDATDSGKQEIRLRSQLKYIEKTISSIKFLLRVKENESRNQY